MIGGRFSNFLKVQTKTAWGRTLADFAAFCAPRPAAMILDVGCGPGLLPSIFARAGHRAFGLDTDRSLLASGLSTDLVQADAYHLPFRASTIDLLTAVNVLFLLDEPVRVLAGWCRLLKPGGAVCLLNPSERLSVATASRLADERGLDSASCESLVNWARNAETYVRWREEETRDLFSRAGLRLVETRLRVGPGFARLSRGILD